MHLVIFEARPRPERFDAYLALAGGLRPELERLEGFLENRRFRSRRRPGWLLSLSTWRDEAALLRWRDHGPHRRAQRQGRTEIFEDYRLRVGRTLDGEPAPGGRPARLATILELEGAEAAASPEAVLAAALAVDPRLPQAGALPGWDLFEGLQAPEARLLLLTWPDGTLAPDGPAAGLHVQVMRDYGLACRAEAPPGGG